MASSGAAALIVGPLGANPAFLALPPFAGAAWYTQMAGVTLAMTAMQVFAKAQMNTASLKDEFEKLYEMNVRNIPETQWPDGNEEGEIQKLLSVYKKKSKKFIDLHVKSKEQVREIRNVVSVFVATKSPGGKLPSGTGMQDLIAQINEHMYGKAEEQRLASQGSRSLKAKTKPVESSDAPTAPAGQGRRSASATVQPMPHGWWYHWMAAYCLVVRSFCGLRCLVTRC